MNIDTHHTQHCYLEHALLLSRFLEEVFQVSDAILQPSQLSKFLPETKSSE
jgi:hypothetical protein